MQKFFTLLLLSGFLALNAQQTANRFFYELTFKPKKDSARTDKVMTILDITKDKSVYQDYTVPAQDSIIKIAVEEMEKTQTFKDMSKTITMPKFSGKVFKYYPSMKESYQDRISMNLFGYEEELKFNWNIQTEKQKIGEYNTQKATTEFGGRKWTAWFSTDLPFQDGPYKFHGLPGLIVKIEDDGKNYSWELKGNKKLNDWKELSYAEQANAKYGMSNDVKIISKERFEKAYADFKQDPMAEARARVPKDMLGMKMPGSDSTIGEMIKQQEKMLNDFFNANNNPIEIPAEKGKK